MHQLPDPWTTQPKSCVLKFNASGQPRDSPAFQIMVGAIGPQYGQFCRVWGFCSLFNIFKELGVKNLSLLKCQVLLLFLALTPDLTTLTSQSSYSIS